jgi:perosamine synthetase
MIPYGRQLIDDDDVAEVVRVLRSDFLTTGPEVDAFESALAAIGGVRHAVAVCNGTAALHAAYAAAGIGPDHEVITTPLTFSATANMVLALGGRPVFVDVEPDTLCIDPELVERAITPRTRAIAAVDYAGHPAALDRLMELAARRKLTVIEDASHSIGGTLHGRPVGSLSHLTTFSFHPVKTITTAEGGAVLTDDAAMAQRARDFRNHGLVRDAARLGQNPGPWYYEIQSLGLNYRLTDMQCALGRSQLRKLGRFVARRTQIVAAYHQAFAELPALQLVRTSAQARPAWHLFPVRVRGGARARAALHTALRERGVGTQVHYVPVNAMPLYRGLGFDPAATPVATAASDSLISLPLFPAMTDDDVSRVIAAVQASVAGL